jgi:hypothetical protein
MSKSQPTTKEELETIVNRAFRQLANEIGGVLNDMLEKIDNRFNRIEAVLPVHDLAVKEQELRLTKMEIKSVETTKRIDKLAFSNT